MARHTADSYDRIAELTQQYSAEALPEDVRDIIPDFFLESYDKSERVENFGRYDYVTDSLTDEEYTIGSSLETEGNGEGERDEAEGVPLLRNVLNNLDDIPVDLKSSGQVFDEYFREGCGCHRKCHERFPKFMAFEAHLDALDADQYCPDHINHQHLLLLGAMNSLVQNHPTTIAKEHRPKDRKNARTQFRFRGQEVCRKFFLFVFGCGEKRVKNVMKQFLHSGISPKAHESAQMTKEIIKFDANHLRRDATFFIRNYAQQHSLQLSGRYVAADGSARDLFLLPAVANMTRKYIYDQYMICCRDLKREGVSFALWGALWDWLCPNVMVPKNKYENCRECRAHQYTISKPEPLNENRKLRSTERFIHHLSQVHHELTYYKSLVDSCKQALLQCQQQPTSGSGVVPAVDRPYPTSMHYTFDWYTTVSLPYSSRLSSIYFHSSYKVSLFGVCVEPLEKFYLYIVPEFIMGNADRLPDITVSLINHFFTNYALNESQTYCHFGDNCVQQSKNNHILSYFMWRSVTGLNEKIILSYMPSGHSRSWNDLFMGVFKKKFRNCDVNSLQDVYQIAERCCGPSNSITPVLVGNDSGDIEFPLLDWNEKFSHINNLDASILTANNHFEISNEVPGLVLCRRLVNSDTISYALIANEDLESISGDLPECLEIEGMPYERRKYLFDSIRDFTAVNYRPLICPDPNVDTIASNLILMDTAGDRTNSRKSIFSPKSNKKLKVERKDSPKKADNSAGDSGSKRKRAGPPKCSYCKGVGHRERIFGKTTCPKKKVDSMILTPSKPTAAALSVAQTMVTIVSTAGQEIGAGDADNSADGNDKQSGAKPESSLDINSNEMPDAVLPDND